DVLEEESITARPLLGRRHVLDVAPGRPGVDPPGDRLDLLLAERAVVDEPLDPDAFVEIPRRHFPADDSGLDRSDPRTDLLVRDQRHRSDVARSVADLAFLLENWRDI